MNKFVAILLVALVACQVASAQNDFDEESQLSLNPSDEEETEGLSGPTQVFSDFCIKSRDYVMGDIKATTNSAAANVFSLFFKSAEELGLEALNTQKDSVQKLGDQIRNPDAAISAGSGSEIDNIIADGQQKIHEAQVQPRSIFQAIVATLRATGTTVATEVLNRLNYIKATMGLNTLTSALTEACVKIDELEENIKSQFEEFKGQDAALSAFQIEGVNCLTSKRIMRLQGLCSFTKISQGPVMKMLTGRRR